MSDTAVHDVRTATAAEVLGGVPDDAGTRELWAGLGSAGLLDGLYSGPPGRPGVDVGRMDELLDAVDGRGAAGTTLSVCVQVATALPLLGGMLDGSPPAQEAHRRALAGEWIVALAATDRPAGSDLTALESTVDVEDGVLELTGHKRWITNATIADQFLVLARTRPGRHFTDFVWVLVPASADGVTTRPADTDLFGGSGVGHIDLDRVRLPATCLVGRPGRGLASFARQIGVERLAGGLWAVSLCRRVLRETRRWLELRSVEDEPLWSRDVVRQRFADCLVRVHQLRALCVTLADRVVAHDTAAAAVVKAAAGPVVEHVIAECAQLQGAEGFTGDGAARLRAECGVFSIGGGTTEVVRSVVADNADALLRDLPSWT